MRKAIHPSRIAVSTAGDDVGFGVPNGIVDPIAAIKPNIPAIKTGLRCNIRFEPIRIKIANKAALFVEESIRRNAIAVATVASRVFLLPFLLSRTLLIGHFRPTQWSRLFTLLSFDFSAGAALIAKTKSPVFVAGEKLNRGWKSLIAEITATHIRRISHSKILGDLCMVTKEKNDPMHFEFVTP